MLLRRSTPAHAATGRLAAPAIVERSNAQSALRLEHAKGTTLEVNSGKHPSGRAVGCRGVRRLSRSLPVSKSVLNRNP